MKQIPNLFTLLNLVFGFLAIILIMQTGETLITVNEGQATINLPEKIYWGAICIGLAAVIDYLDGFVARLFNATSELGKQLDSLADIVSFGVAPGLIMYQLLRMSYVQQVNGLDISMWALAPAVLLPCAGAYRLARFNTMNNEQPGFSGVPIPAAGLVIASLPLIMWYDYFQINELLLNKWFLYVLIIVMSWLMVSKLPLMALKFKDFNFKNNLPQFVLIVMAIISAVLLKWVAVPVIFIFYILISLLPFGKTNGRVGKTEL
jgi:CDP-diacylglycerol--serine O-phosphatidyltransferase